MAENAEALSDCHIEKGFCCCNTLPFLCDFHMDNNGCDCDKHP